MGKVLPETFSSLSEVLLSDTRPQGPGARYFIYAMLKTWLPSR